MPSKPQSTKFLRRKAVFYQLLYMRANQEYLLAEAKEMNREIEKKLKDIAEVNKNLSTELEKSRKTSDVYTSKD